MSSAKPRKSISGASRAALAVGVRCDDEDVYVKLSDGREASAPVTPRLRAATPRQRRACRVVDFGTAIRWDDINEDIGVEYFLGVPEDEVLELARLRPGMPDD